MKLNELKTLHEFVAPPKRDDGGDGDGDGESHQPERFKIVYAAALKCLSANPLTMKGIRHLMNKTDNLWVEGFDRIEEARKEEDFEKLVSEIETTIDEIADKAIEFFYEMKKRHPEISEVKYDHDKLSLDDIHKIAVKLDPKLYDLTKAQDVLHQAKSKVHAKITKKAVGPKLELAADEVAKLYQKGWDAWLKQCKLNPQPSDVRNFLMDFKQKPDISKLKKGAELAKLMRAQSEKDWVYFSIDNARSELKDRNSAKIAELHDLISDANHHYPKKFFELVKQKISALNPNS